MDIVKRIKNILVTPKTEWEPIDAEQYPSSKLLTSYLLLLALIPAIGNFIGYGLVGQSVLGIRIGGTISWGLKQAVISYISTVGGVYLTAFIINLLAESFNSVKNFDKAFALVVYSYTPLYIAGVFYILPSLSILAMLASIYGLYILYTGIKPMMKTPDDKVTVYFVISLVCMIVVAFVLSLILGAIFLTSHVAVNL